MKSKDRKLSLSKQTIKNLENRLTLEQAQGGFTLRTCGQVYTCHWDTCWNCY